MILYIKQIKQAPLPSVIIKNYNFQTKRIYYYSTNYN